MHSDKSKQRKLLFQNIIYYLLLVLVVGMLGWLSVRYSTQFDWSASNRNTLSDSSRVVLDQLAGPVKVSVYIGEDEVTRNAIRELVERYRRYKNDLNLDFINPDLNPAQARALSIGSAGELLIEYQGKQERLQQLSEQNFTNALQRLLRSGERWIVFLSGHGERDPNDVANHALSDFARRLSDKGFNIQVLSLLEQAEIPDNTHVLVIASPQTNYLDGEVKLIKEYLERGGNMLWLLEPDNLFGLEALAEYIGISQLPGKVVDATTQLFGISQPDFALVLNYPQTPVTPDFAQFTLFPQAAGIRYDAQVDQLGFSEQAFLQTLPRSWTETGPISGRIQYDENTTEVLGPVTLGLSLSRVIEKPETDPDRLDNNEARSSTGGQRVAVVGDGDFLSNAYLGNGGNLELGLNIINWLSHDDDLIDIKPVSAPDTQLQLSNVQLIVIAVLFLLVIPFGLVSAGLIIWLRRRKK